MVMQTPPERDSPEPTKIKQPQCEHRTHNKKSRPSDANSQRSSETHLAHVGAARNTKVVAGEQNRGVAPVRLQDASDPGQVRKSTP